MINDYIKAIDALSDVFRDLIAIANIKLKASTENRVATLEECMTKEQTLSLKLRGADKKRTDLQEKLGFGNLTFKQILEKSDEETQKLLLPSFDRFSSEVQRFQSINDEVTISINTNLRKIGRQMDTSGEKKYKKDAVGDRPEIRFTDKSV